MVKVSTVKKAPLIERNAGLDDVLFFFFIRFRSSIGGTAHASRRTVQFAACVLWNGRVIKHVISRPFSVFSRYFFSSSFFTMRPAASRDVYCVRVEKKEKKHRTDRRETDGPREKQLFSAR